MIEISEFIERLNECLPSLQQIAAREAKLGHYVTPRDPAKVQNSLRYNYNSDGSAIPGDALHELTENTNVGEIGIGIVVFYRKIKEKSNGFEFAQHNDFYRFCLVHSGKIIWYDNESDNIEVVAESLDQFFEFMLVYDKYYMKVVYDVSFAAEDWRRELQKLLEEGLSAALVRQLIPDL